MLANLYKAVCIRLLQADFTERISLCCLCLETVGEKGASVDDEVTLSLQEGLPPKTIKLSQLLKFLIGQNFSEIMYVLKSVCEQCMISAIAGYKFIERCKNTAKIIVTVLEKFEGSFNGILPHDKFNCKSLYVAIELNKTSTTTMVKRYYDNRRQFIPLDTAFLRFKQLIGSNNQTHNISRTYNTQDEINNYTPIRINKIDQSLQALMCCKTNIHIKELLDDPNKPYEYKCKFCPEQFAKSTTLRIHFFKVHRKKEFKCVKCSKTQAKQSNIQLANMNTIQKQPMIILTGKDQPNPITIHQLEKDPLHPQDTEQYEDDHQYNMDQEPLQYGHYEQEQNIAPVVEPTEFIELSDNLNQKRSSSVLKYGGLQIIEDKTIKPYSCKKCGMKFSTRQRYLTHVQNYQNKCIRPPKGRGEFKCAQCSYTAFYRHLVARHIRFKHLGELGFVCDFCGKNYPSKTQLASHIRTHTNEKPFECGQCGRKYATESGLKIHTYTHTGERPYKCEFCGEGFRSGSCRGDHITRHHKPPTLKCKICGLMFKFKIELTRHEDMHLNAKMHRKFMEASKKRKNR